MSKLKDPWETGEAICTEEKWVAWIRGAIRKAWTRYPTQNEYKNSMRKKSPVLDDKGNQKYYKSGKKKGKPVTRFECPCEDCGEVFPASYVQVDHIQSAGSTKNKDDLLEWIVKIFCGKDNLQLLCKDCHAIKTHMDRNGFTKEEAVKDKQRIEFFKQPVTKQKEQLKKLGASKDDLRNDENRRRFYEQNR